MIQPRDLNEQDVRVLYSFGAAGRYVPVTEVQKAQVLMNALKLKNLGLVDVDLAGNGDSKVASYGLNSKGLETLERYPQLKPKSVEDCLFGVVKPAQERPVSTA